MPVIKPYVRVFRGMLYLATQLILSIRLGSFEKFTVEYNIGANVAMQCRSCGQKHKKS